MYAKIDNGIVTLVSSAYFEGAIEAPDGITIGMEFSNGAFKKSFEQQKQDKLDELNAYVNEKLNLYLAKYPEVEVQSFTQKANESSMVITDNNTPLTLTPYLSALTNNDLIARKELANAVQAKVLENAQLEAFAVATRDAIKACTTEEELNNVTW